MNDEEMKSTRIIPSEKDYDKSEVSSTDLLAVKATELRKAIEDLNSHIESLKAGNWQTEDIADARSERNRLVTALINLIDNNWMQSIAEEDIHKY